MTTSRTFDLLISYIKRDRHLTLVIKHTMVYSNHWSTHGSQQMQFELSWIISAIKNFPLLETLLRSCLPFALLTR